MPSSPAGDPCRERGPRARGAGLAGEAQGQGGCRRRAGAVLCARHGSSRPPSQSDAVTARDLAARGGGAVW
jgi:hypothetical protein